MTIPAAREDHPYLCGADPVTGVIDSPDQRHVKIVGLRAARFSDACSCVLGHASPIAEGAAQVLIGGLPAARLGVKSLNGGHLLSGEPTVLIGGDLFALPPGIIIEGGPFFQAVVLKDLYKLGSTAAGKALFADLKEEGRKWTIAPGPSPDGKTYSHTVTDPQLETPRDLDGDWSFKKPHPTTKDDPRSIDGTGIDAKTYYNPSQSEADSHLLHEGVHASDINAGIADERPCPNPGGEEDHIPAGERKATGLPPYDDPDEYPFSQNKYNKEHGYPPYRYYGPGGNK
jgi:uncharacterized Zn-binding protein involved in type VI secretion